MISMSLADFLVVLAAAGILGALICRPKTFLE
jgi:hypothetical protein